MSSIKIILLGFLRHTIGLLGMWLVTKGYLGAEAKDAWIAKAVEEAFGGILISTAYFWSAIDKQFVIGWIRQAFHMQTPTPAGEKAAAQKISNLITSPGTTPVPEIPKQP